MFTLSESASVILSELLEENRQSDGDVFRLERNGDQFGLIVDQQHDGDEVFHQNEKPVLVLNTDVAEHLAEVAMDFTETPEGQQLKLMPKADADTD